MDTPSAPSFNLNTKSWHGNCRSANSSVRPWQSHFSVPTAARLRRRVEWRSRMGAAWRPPEGLVLDGREHGGRLLLSGGKAIKNRAFGPIRKRDPAQQLDPRVEQRDPHRPQQE